MLKIHEIREIIKLMDQSSLQEFEMEGEGIRLSIKKGGKTPAAVLPSEMPAHVVTAPPAAPVLPLQPKVEAPVTEVPAPKAEKGPEPKAADETQFHKIVSPMVGTFYSKPDPSSPPFVQPGDKIKPNTVVCIVEAMKLFNEIEAEVSGEIVKVLVNDGQLVEYGQPLFLVKPE